MIECLALSPYLSCTQSPLQNFQSAVLKTFPNLQIRTCKQKRVYADTYKSLIVRVEWSPLYLYTGEDTAWRISRTEYCFIGVGGLLMLWPPLPWKLRDLHPCPNSSLLERAPELLEPRPESQEDPSDGISSHNMTTLLSTSLTLSDKFLMKPRLPFFFLDFFLTLSILTPTRRSKSCIDCS